MSKQVDERVVSMQFDNRHFEKNVQTTMSTLDKLKEKLSFKGASKGLENVNSAAKNVNMSGVSGAVDTVRSRFSAMEVVGVTALANITNSAVNAGKRIVSALTIDPIKTGFNEYETKINAIQTIMANTESKGTTMSDVTQALDELNTYADKTIYNFAEMTKNIGTFTAAGIGLKDSVSAIQGIANLAAISGSTSQQASTAMYQLSQALSTGTVRLMDWNSVVNAGMGGEVFQNAIKRTARVHGVAVDDIIKKSGSFRDSLSEEWLTADILTETLQHFTMAAEEGTKQWNEYKASLMEKGYTETQANEILKMANTATSAATEIKTFSQLMDATKESIQSGWAKTWEILFGDFEEAKSLFSGIYKTVDGFVSKISDARNNMLEGAFGSPWKKFDSILKKTNVSVEDFRKTLKETAKENGVDVDALVDKYKTFDNALAAGAISTDIINKAIDKLFGTEKDAVKSTEDMTEKLEYFQKVVNEVWHGDYANGEARVKALTKAGYDYAAVQDLVNKTVDGHKLTLEDLSDAQLKSVGYNDKQIKSIRELEKVAQESGVSLDELIEQMGKPSGRWLLIDSLKNACSGLGMVFKSIGQAWNEIFEPKKTDEKAASLYNLLERLNEFSQKLKANEETAQKWVRTFKGVFALLDIVATLVTGPIKIAFKLLNAILKEMDLPILDLTANVGDAIVKFRNWLDGLIDFEGIAKKIVPPLEKAIKAFKSWIETLKESDNIPRDIVKGLINGLGSGIKMVAQAAMELGKKIIEVVKNVLGIHSPSTVFKEIGEFTIQGFIDGLKSKASGVWEFLKGFVTNTKEFLTGLDWGTVFAGGITVGTLAGVFKIINVMESLTAPLEGFGDLLEGAGKALKNFGSYFSAKAWHERSKALLKAAIAIAILAGVLVLLSHVNTDNLLEAAGALLAISVALSIVAVAISKLSSSVGSINIGKKGADLGGLTKALNTLAMGFAMASFATAVLILVGAVKLLSTIEPDKLAYASKVLGGIGAMLIAFLAVTRIAGDNAGQAGKMLFKFSLALLILVGIIKLIEGLSFEAILKGVAVIAALEVLMMGLVFFSMFAGKNASKAGKMLFKISLTLLILVGVIKLIEGLSYEAILKGVAVIAALEVLMMGLVFFSMFAGKNASKAGSMLLKISIALAIMVGVINLIGKLDNATVKRGIVVMGAIGILFAGLIAVTNLAGAHSVKAATSLVIMSGAMIILAGIIYLIGKMNPDSLKQGLAVVLILGAMFAGLIATTYLANDCKSTLIMMAIIIGELAALVVGFSFIDPTKLRNATLAISTIVATFALLIGVTKFSKNAKQMIRTLVTLTIITGLLAGIIVGLSFLPNPQNAVVTAGALAIVLTALSASIVILSKVSRVVTKSTKKSVYQLLGVIIVLGAVIVAMNRFADASGSIANATALSILLTAVAGVVTLLSMTTKGVKLKELETGVLGLVSVAASLFVLVGVLIAMNGVDVAAGNVGALVILATACTALLIPLSLIGQIFKVSDIMIGVLGLAALGLVLRELVWVLASMDNLTNALTNTKALTILATALSLLLIPLSIVGIVMASTYGLAALGIVALAAMGLVLRELVWVLASMDGIANASINTNLLVTLMTAMTKALAVLALVGPLALIGLAAMQGLIILMAEIGVFAAAVGALVTKFPQLEEFLDTGLPILEKLANGIGSIVGNLISGFMGGIADGLPAIAVSLSLFMGLLQPFIAGAKLIDEEVIAGIKRLAGAIILLTAAELLNSIGNFMSIGSGGLVGLAVQLSMFMAQLQPFIAGAALLTPEMMSGVKTLAETILILTAANVLEGLGRFFGMGGGTLAEFGAQLPALGTSLQQFVTNLGTFGEAQVTTITCAAEAIKNMAQAADLIPNSGGWLGKIVGENDIGTFGAQLGPLGTYLNEFITNIGTFNEDQVATAGYAADAVAKMAQAAEKIPSSGGWLGKIVGENDISTFGAQLPAVGKALNGFVTEIGEFTPAKAETAKVAAQALQYLAEAADKMPTGGGWWQKLVGDKTSLEEFSGQLPDVATALKGFVTELGTFNDAQVATTQSAVKAINAFADLGNADLAGLSASLPAFGEKLAGFAGKIKDFTASMSGVTGVDGAIAEIDKLVELFKRIGSASSSAVAEFSEGLKSLGNTGVDNFVSAFTNASERVKTAGMEMVNNLISGVSQNSDAANENFKQLASNGVEALNDKHSEFYNAGVYVVKGFASGLGDSAAIAQVKAKAEAMVAAAVAAAEAAAGIQSPSRVFKALGVYIPEGFALGIDKGGNTVVNATDDMVNTAVSGVKDSISMIATAISSDIDSQPTIRPVLDLSDVKSGASAINGMFGSGTSVGVLAKVGTISQSMNNRVQNGGNDDVVSAIDKLNANIGNLDHPSYTIGNITFAGDDEVAAAFETIIRAARIERRV